MNQDELNDRILALNEVHFAEVEDDEEKEDKWNSEAANIAEDTFMDSRDGFDD